MGKVVRLIIPDLCRTEHRLYHAVGRACPICVPDSYARHILWNEKYKRWWPLMWAEDGYWDYDQNCFINEEGKRALPVPATYVGDRPFEGWGPGVRIVVEDIPDEDYQRLMAAQKAGLPPGTFEKAWFEYEDKKKLVDS